MLTFSLMTAAAIAACAAARGGDVRREQAIETRPLWERPSDRLTPYERAESELDRGNGRIVDEQTHQLDRIRAERLLEVGRVGDADILLEDRDRDLRIEQKQREVQRQTRQRKIEYEQDVLRDERERFLKRIEAEQREGPFAAPNASSGSRTSTTQPTSRESRRSTTQPSHPRTRVRGYEGRIMNDE
jgi:hypothetical protein